MQGKKQGPHAEMWGNMKTTEALGSKSLIKVDEPPANVFVI